jgi:hypothetical protein
LGTGDDISVIFCADNVCSLVTKIHTM